MYQEYFNYYLELERDFFATEPYVTIDEDNYNTFSIQYNRIYQSICSEIDCLLKELCRQLEQGCEARTLGAYYPIIQSHFKYFCVEKVSFYKSRIELQPWKEWVKGKAPSWWTMYNNVKHHRMEMEEKNKKSYYKYANLENVLNALAALYVVELYYIYSYEFSGIEKEELAKKYTCNAEEGAKKEKNQMMIHCASKCMEIKEWNRFKSYFAGYTHFDIEKLDEFIKNRN